MYYFVSDRDFDGQTLYPRLPENRAPNEDESTERVCVSQSIDGCLVATYYGVGNIIYVHTCESDQVISPTFKQVEDAMFTGEQWILEPVEMKLLIRLKITQVIKRTLGDKIPLNTYCYGIYLNDLDKLA